MGCGAGKSATQIHAPTKKEPLPEALAAAPKGRFQSLLPPIEEGRRDFARIFFADQRKIFFISRGMPSMRPLQPTVGPSAAHIGDLTPQVIERAEALFCESLTKQMSAQEGGIVPDKSLVENLMTRAMVAMSVNVGVDFALHMKLMPTFLQPLFVIIMLGDPLEARAATYGFVASTPRQVIGDRPEAKRTPFCVRLLSPNLLEREMDSKACEVEYRVKELQASSIRQVAESEVPDMRAAIASNRWDPML